MLEELLCLLHIIFHTYEPVEYFCQFNNLINCYKKSEAIEYLTIILLVIAYQKKKLEFNQLEYD